MCKQFDTSSRGLKTSTQRARTEHFPLIKERVQSEQTPHLFEEPKKKARTKNRTDRFVQVVNGVVFDRPRFLKSCESEDRPVNPDCLLEEVFTDAEWKAAGELAKMEVISRDFYNQNLKPRVTDLKQLAEATRIKESYLNPPTPEKKQKVKKKQSQKRPKPDEPEKKEE